MSGALLAREAATEALECAAAGLDDAALDLMDLASSADPSSPDIFAAHLNLLYTHGHDGRAAARLRAFEAYRPHDPRLAASRQVCSPHLFSASLPISPRGSPRVRGSW